MADSIHLQAAKSHEDAAKAHHTAADHDAKGDHKMVTEHAQKAHHLAETALKHSTEAFKKAGSTNKAA